MPSTRTVRRAKKRSTRKLSRCSSISSGFSKSNILITSSPLQDDLMEKEFLFNSLDDYKFECKYYYEETKPHIISFKSNKNSYYNLYIHAVKKLYFT